MITKWWADDKITDGDYANAIGYVSDGDVLSSHDDIQIMMADDPIDDEVTWEEMISDLTPDYWDRPAKTDDNADDFLSLVPKNFATNEDEKFSAEDSLGLPDWFKNTAQWWAKDKITDKEFKKNVEFLVKEGIVKSQTSDVFNQIIKDGPASVESKKVANEESSVVESEKPTVSTQEAPTQTESEKTQLPVENSNDLVVSDGL